MDFGGYGYGAAVVDLVRRHLESRDEEDELRPFVLGSTVDIKAMRERFGGWHVHCGLRCVRPGLKYPPFTLLIWSIGSETRGEDFILAWVVLDR